MSQSPENFDPPTRESGSPVSRPDADPATPENPYGHAYGMVSGRGLVYLHLYRDDFGEGRRSNDRMLVQFADIDPEETIFL